MPELLEGKAAVGHLLRRAGFGPRLDTWSEWAALSYEEAVERVLADLRVPRAKDPAGFDAYVPGAIQQLWLERMVRAPVGLAEKLTLFWHGHFATSDAKIEDPQLMWRQYALLRDKGAGSFRELVKGISRDVAMIRWLDGNSNRRGHANENYARELQELFTLGIGNYTETDIREIGRAFTGWGSRHHDFVIRESFHDDGEKTIHGQTGNFDGDDVVDILVTLPACARFIAGKLLRSFSHPEPTEAEIEALAGVMREAGLDIEATLGALFRAPAFRATSRYRVLVRSPVEFVVGALRATGVDQVEPWMHGALDRMGQILFRPPSVKGWTSGRGWLSSGAVVERLRAAQRIATLAAPQARAGILEVAFQGDVPEALAESLSGSGPQAAAALALGGPEFQLY